MRYCSSYFPYIQLLPLSLLLLGIMTPVTLFAALNPDEIRVQQDILHSQRQEQLRQTMQSAHDVRLNEDTAREAGNQPTADDNKQPCFAINEVVLVGEHSQIFQFALNQALRQTGFQAGKCLNAGDINQIMTLAQNILIGRGYTTTRILAAPQDLNSGKLVLTVLAGYLKNIEVDMSQANQTHAGRIAAFQNEFPTRSDGILNLRDLEQGLENLKRIPTAEADIQIVPVDGVPNQSTVLVKWQQRWVPYRLNVGLDDSGTIATGKYQGNITFSADNPLGLSDLFYVNYGRSIGHVPDAADGSGNLKRGGTHHYALHYSVPFGKWTWAFNHSAYRYHQAVAGLNTAYDYNGRSYSTDLGFNRLIYRDAQRKTHFGAKVWTRETRSYIDDAELTVQRRRTAGWLAELSHKEYLGSSTAHFRLAYKRGTGMQEALRAPEEAFGEGTSRMKIWTASANVHIPFQIGNQSFSYDTAIQAQWNKTPLTPQDKFAIGGRYTVRGFDGEMSLAAERGWYWRNDVSWQFRQEHQLYVGADVGHVSGPSARSLLGQTLAGATVGVRGQMRAGGHLHYDLFASRAVRKPEYFQTKRWVMGVWVSYGF